MYLLTKQPLFMRLTIFLLLISCSFQLFATEAPQKIYPLTHSILSIEFYETQLAAWEQELDTNKNNADAWLNYYTAAHNINVLKTQEIYDLKQVLKACEQNTGQSFEYYYMLYRQSGIFDRDFDALYKAHELASERTEIYPDLLLYYQASNKQAAFEQICHKLYRSQKLSSGILEWNYNALMSVKENGILLTQGDNDTYPAWILQEIQSVRQDVRVVNLYLLLSEKSYRERIFQQLSVNANFTPLASTEQELIRLIKHLQAHCQAPLFLGIATPQELRKQFNNKLFISGLAFEHSDRKVDNISMLDYNFQTQFRMDQLEQALNYDASTTVVNHMNMNYIPSFALLYRYYNNNNRKLDALYTKSLITTIASRAEKLDEVERLFGAKTNEDKKGAALLSTKSIDKQMLIVKENLYASETELSNAEYRLFLKNLLDNNEFEKLQACKIHPTDWLSLLPEQEKGLDMASASSNGGNPNDDNYPIVNISYEAAQEYCRWLTEAYNNCDYKRKRFSKVVFRLPSKEEWEAAATDQYGRGPYPWGGPYFRNAKGCLLANFNPQIEMQKDGKLANTEFTCDEDGAFFPTSTTAYFPNGNGFYNMAGNVAEMTAEEGLVKGGSWNDPAYFMQIKTDQTQTLPSAEVGFRVFMEVIEQ